MSTMYNNILTSFFITLLSLSFYQTALALPSGNVTVNRGDQPIASPLILIWDIAGSVSNSCDGDFSGVTYPAIGVNDGINAGWKTNHPTVNGSGDTSSIAGWGTKVYAPGGVYTFTCTDTSVNPPVSDSVDVTVKDCPDFNPGTIWDQASHTCVAGAPPTVTVQGFAADGTSFANGNVSVSYNQNPSFSWNVTDATSCNLFYNNVNQGAVAANNGNRNIGVLGGSGAKDVKVSCSNAGFTTVSNTIHFFVPPSPASVTATCPAPGTTLTINAIAPVGYTFISPRTYDFANGWSSAAWKNAIASGAPYVRGEAGSLYDTAYNGTQASHTYNYYAQVNGVNGSLGAPSAEKQITCTPPAPSPSLSGSDISSPLLMPVGTTGSATLNFGDQFNLTWAAVPSATTCTLDGANVSTAGGNVVKTVSPWAGETYTYTLSCSGPGGIGSSNLVLSYPKAPSPITVVCSPSGTSATISWPQAGAFTHYMTRAESPLGTNNISGQNDDYNAAANGYSITVNGINPPAAGVRVYGKIRSRAANGALSDVNPGQALCKRPAPTVTLTATTVNGGNTGSATYHEGGATLTFTASDAATSCDVYKNGILSQASAISPYTIPSAEIDSSNPVYTVKCTNGLIGTSPAVTINVPPKPTVPTASCPAPATTVNLGWTMPNGFTGYSLSSYDIAIGQKGCALGDICNSANGSSYSFASLSGHDYNWVVSTKIANGNVSEQNGGFVSCKVTNLQAGIYSIAPSPTTETAITVLSGNITNNGTLSSGIGFKNFFQVKHGDATANDAVTLIDDVPSVAIAALAVGTSVDVQSNYAFPSSGNYSYRLCADKMNRADAGLVGESDENDNCSAWKDAVIQRLPDVSLEVTPNAGVRPFDNVDITSTSTDVDGNITDHNFLYITPAPTNIKLTNPAGPGAEATVAIISGLTGNFTPNIGTNTYVRRFKPLHPGIYIIQAVAKESIYTGEILKQFSLTVDCAVTEWWNGTACVSPSATLASTCNNGALDAPTCVKCPPTSIYNNGKCVAGNSCFINSEALPSSVCGDGVIQSGEECDGGPQGVGTLGLSNSAKQKCSSICTITCTQNTVDGSPSCGAGVGKVFNPQGVKVAACTNGALQSTAPDCGRSGPVNANGVSVCAFGETRVIKQDGSIICKAPVCGDGILNSNTSEQCDGSSGLPGDGSKFCTPNCCQLPLVAAPLPGANLPTYTLSCVDSDSYKVTNAAGNVLKQGAYGALPISYRPVAEGTYTYSCLVTSPALESHVTITATAPPLVAPTSLSRVLLSATPKSISANSSVTISWSIDKPDLSCRIMASPIIATSTLTCGEECIADRYREANRINSELISSKTDVSDGSRPMNTALQTINVGTSAIGRKTVSLKYSTTLYGSCSPNALADKGASKIKLKVVGDSEN